MTKTMQHDFGKFRSRLNDWSGWHLFESWSGEGRAAQPERDREPEKLSVPVDLLDAWRRVLDSMNRAGTQKQLAAELESSLTLIDKTLNALHGGHKEPLLERILTSYEGRQKLVELLSDVRIELKPVFDELIQAGFQSNQLQKLMEQLESLEVDDAPEFVSGLGVLIREIRDQAESEKEEMEHFLAQMSANLASIEETVRSSEKSRVDMMENRRQMDVSIQQETRLIEGIARHAKDLSVLKKSIQGRVTSIRSQVVKCQQVEEVIQRKSREEMQKLTSKLRDMEAEAEQLKIQVQKEHVFAMSDPLTGVGNRRAYDEAIAREYQRWRRYGNPLSVVVGDIDYFKRVNDSLGHAVGDEVLKTIAREISTNLRESDIVARIGGEEFAIILPETTEPEAWAVAEKLRTAIEGLSFDGLGYDICITMSFGVTGFKDTDTRAAVFDRVDNALYKAKHGGRNQCFQQ